MSLEPKIINKVKDSKNHKELLENLASNIGEDSIDLIINILYEFEEIRQSLMSKLTSSFLFGHSAAFEHDAAYHNFISLIRNINIIRYLCREDLSAIDLDIVVDDDNNLVITKGNVTHTHDKTILVHDGFKYTIDDKDCDLGCFANLITDEDGSYLDELIDNYTAPWRNIKREAI